MSQNPLIDIIIPVYNEERVLADSIKKVIEHLEDGEFPYDYKVTVVNNASTDRTFEICSELSEQFSQVRSIDLSAKGKGRAIKAGWSQSRGDVLVFMDVDLASDLNYLKSLIDAVAVEGHDMAIGNRLGANSKIIGRRFHREIMSRCYNFIIRMLFGSPFADHQCGFKAMKKKSYMSIAPTLQDDRWFIDTELIVRALRAGHRIKAVDIVWYDRTGSKVSIPKTSFELFKSALALRRQI